jgi:ABC-type bacteriocin/lantibiotic exporter with double-glycine peptidase domain
MMPVISILAMSMWLNLPLDLAGFFASIWILRDLSEYIQHIPHSLNLYASSNACAKRIKKLLESKDFELDESLSSNDSTHELRAFVLEDLTVEIGGKLILDRLSAVIDLTKINVIIGAVGSGKSILLQIFSGEITPSSGRLLVEFKNGARINYFSTQFYHYLREKFAYVPQQAFVANASVAENIVLLDKFEDNHIWRAAEMSQLAPDIKDMPNSIHQEVGEVGVSLSGGQMQRLELARAFHASRDVLLLDDPFAALDEKVENELLEVLKQRSFGVIIVTHRHRIAHQAHAVYRMEHGRMVEEK